MMLCLFAIPIINFSQKMPRGILKKVFWGNSLNEGNGVRLMASVVLGTQCVHRPST